MGQKVHPYGFRLGYTKPWKSRWFVTRDYDKLLLEDVKLKDELKDKLKSAGVSSIEVEDGSALAAVDLTPDLFGTLELHAYKVLTSGTIARDTRMVVVDPPDDFRDSNPPSNAALLDALAKATRRSRTEIWLKAVKEFCRDEMHKATLVNRLSRRDGMGGE